MSKTLCFTGHRPDKLGGYNMLSSKNIAIASKIKEDIVRLIETEDIKTFICGGALGIDQMAFRIVYGLKSLYPDIKVIIAAPFTGQDRKWISESQNEYQSQLNQADKIVLVDELDGYTILGSKAGEYHPVKMQLRNQWMVDNSDIVYAVWNNTKGGTANCVKYAKKINKEVLGFNPDKI